MVTAQELQAAVDAVPYWYHKVPLPHGIITPGWAPHDVSAYRIPDRLDGKTVLDIGAWDGGWTFEALRRGASFAFAIDDFSDTIGGNVNADRSAKWHTFDLCRDALGYQNRCHRTELSVYDQLFRADVVFCFGVLYHLRHPLLALEKMRTACNGEIYIETAILDGVRSAYGPDGYDGSECCFEFYPNAEYGKNPSNWYVGTLRAWCGLVEAAGFRNIESWRLTEDPQHIYECRGFIKATV